MLTDGARRDEILDTAAALFASSGIRTSLKDIGDACGILPGSLYHHFDSKEAIIVELVERYRHDLDQVAEVALAGLRQAGAGSTEDRVIDLGQAIAACAVRHRAALLLTLYEPPTASSDVLVDLARQTPTAISAAMGQILDAGRTSGQIRARIDVDLLGERICQSMLHVGVGVFHRSHARQLPAQKCQVFLHGVAVRTPANATLDRSSAMAAASSIIESWNVPEANDRVSLLRSVARTEFGRRGYEATTMRDIAKAAEMSTGTVYRTFRSKDELLVSIMEAFADSFDRGWEAVLGSGSSPIEKLDALMWVNINLLDRFSEEFKIQLAWLRQSPPDSVDLGLSFASQLRLLQGLLAEAERDGGLRPEEASAVSRARSMYEVILTPENVVRHAGPRGALALGRDTVLRGALVSRIPSTSVGSPRP